MIFDRIFVKGYEFLSKYSVLTSANKFATKIAQKFLDSAKKIRSN